MWHFRCITFVVVSLVASEYSSSQTLTQTGGSFTYLLGTGLALPSCNDDGGQTFADLDFGTEEIGFFTKNISGSLTNDCGDGALSHHQASGGNDAPGNVYATASTMAGSVGSGIVAGAVGDFVSATTLSTYNATPPPSMAPGDVLVFYGTYSIGTGGTAMGTGGVLFPDGNTLSAVALTSGITGTVVNVFDGTTKIYSNTEGLATAGTFAVIVPPSFTIGAGATSVVISGVPFPISAGGNGVGVIGGQLGVFDSSAFPAMTIINL